MKYTGTRYEFLEIFRQNGCPYDVEDLPDRIKVRVGGVCVDWRSTSRNQSVHVNGQPPEAVGKIKHMVVYADIIRSSLYRQLSVCKNIRDYENALKDIRPRVTFMPLNSFTYWVVMLFDSEKVPVGIPWIKISRMHKDGFSDKNLARQLTVKIMKGRKIMGVSDAVP